jgi:hypothetical protein
MATTTSALFAHRDGSRPAPLTGALETALASGRPETLQWEEPADDFDEAAALLAIYELWLAPAEMTGGCERFQNHPAVAAIKWELEARMLARLDSWVPASVVEDSDVVGAVRRIARADRPRVYEWVANTASWTELVHFLAIEGGPDGGFDDLVALSQIGISGAPKVVLGANYWDEMGRGDVDAVHTRLHERLVAAVDMPRLAYEQLPLSALHRSALNGLLATNRWLQPEMLGALGLLELQAGPRCRQVLRGLDRVGAPADALPFYEEHAETDPRHGKEWLEEALAPLCEEMPEWTSRVIRGARWRSETNRRLFEDAASLLIETEQRAPEFHQAI